MSKEWKYKPKTIEQIKSMFNSKKPMDFKKLEDFKTWYVNHPKTCHYCSLKEEESQEIVHLGLLTSKRFPFEGKTRRGVFRGYWLEIDRKNPDGPYSEENCVLSCGFCNNDKSDVFSDTQYLEFREDRVGFLRRLLKNENK